MTKLSYTLAYARFFEKMTPDTLGTMNQFLADDVVFKDPFNTLYGADAFVGIFTLMYAVMNNSFHV